MIISIWDDQQLPDWRNECPWFFPPKGITWPDAISRQEYSTIFSQAASESPEFLVFITSKPKVERTGMLTNTLQGWLVCLFLRFQWFYYWNSRRLIFLRPRLLDSWRIMLALCWFQDTGDFCQHFNTFIPMEVKWHLDFKITFIAVCFKTMFSFTPDWFTDFVFRSPW